MSDGVDTVMGAFIANTIGDFDRCRGVRLDDIVEPVFTPLKILLYQHLLPNCFAVAFWFQSRVVSCAPSESLVATAL